MVSPMRSPHLIVTSTPLRISFAGGGTDLPEFYERQFGAVLSTAIDQRLYVTLKRHGQLFNEKYRLNYFCVLPGGRVTLEHIQISETQVGRMFDHLVMFYTGILRDAGPVLAEQKSNTADRLDQLHLMREQAQELRRQLCDGFDPETF